MSAKAAINIDDLKEAARRHLPRAVFDFVEGGVDDEIGLQSSRRAFDRARLVPRVGRDVSKVSTKTTLFGQDFSAPFGIAPTGLAGLFRPGSDSALAQGAAKRKIPFVLSAASNASMEEIAPIADGRLWCQIYGTRDRSIMDDMTRRAASQGVETLFLTLDVPIDARRERNLRNRFSLPYRPSLGAAADALCHPAWLLGYLTSGGMPMVKGWSAYAPAGSSAPQVAAFFKSQTPDPTQTWDDVKRLRDMWRGNLVLKGLLHPQDAQVAREMGANGLVISSHGGRQMDRAPAPLEMVRPIRAAAGDDMAIILDGGIRRGSDIVVALCSGADFAMVGRSTLYGAIAGGGAGVLKAIDILQSEVAATLTQLGCRDAASLDQSYLLPRMPG